ncbi:MAG: hypothetical protein JXX28_03545 [Deltaproteobacteria bacterium]|nr:hypothetical protein [Deltaproteobacteria bacterium]
MILLVALLLASPAEAGRRARVAPLDLSGPLRADTLEALVAELAPLVGEVAGRPFDAVPFAGIGTPDTLARFVASDSRAILTGLYPTLSDEAVRQLSRTHPLEVSGLVGKYAPRAHGVYVSEEALDAVVASGGVSQGERGSYLRLVVAHELVHALQDQQVELDHAFRTCEDFEALQSLRTATEGQAMWVEERVAARLGLTELYWRAAAQQGWGPEGLLVAPAWDLWAVYGQGRTWMDWLYQDGGTEAQWAVIASPPRTTAPAFRRGAAPLQPSRIGEGLDGVELGLTEGDWLAHSSVLGEGALRERTLGVEASVLDALLSRVTEGAQREAVREDRAVWAGLARLDGEGAARALGEHLCAAEPAEALLGEAWAVSREPWEDGAADYACLWTSGPSGPRPARAEVRRLVEVRGREVLLLEARGFRPGLRYQRAVDEVFAGAPAGAGLVAPAPPR